MADVQVQRVSIVASAPATKKVAKGANKSSPKSKKSTSNHPATSEMVTSSIASLKERGGSSLQAIKKQIASTYKIDVNKLSPFIKKYIKNSVSSGKLIQTKGKGVSGSFKLSVSSKEKKSAPKKVKATAGLVEPKSKSITAKPVAAKRKKTVKSAKKGKSLEKKSKKTSAVKKPVPKKTTKPKNVSKSKIAKKPVKKTKVDKKTPSPKKSVK